MCLNTVPISYEDFLGRKQSIDVPCGKCVECQIDLQNSWKIRMIEESKVWKYAYYFTLTYNDDSLPLNVVATYPDSREIVGELRGKCKKHLLLHSFEQVVSTACKKDVQRWFKRFRTSYIRRRARHLGVYVKDITSDKCLYNQLKPRFSYFVTAEYAPEGEYVDRHGRVRRSSMRPHYHGILFTDISQNEISPLFSDWSNRYGFVNWSSVRSRQDSVNAASAPADYCAKYCCKGEFSSRLDDIVDEIIEKPWRLVSKGLGSDYINKMKYEHIPDPHGMSRADYVDLVVRKCLYYDGDFKYKLPKYYKERIFYNKVKVYQRRFNKADRKVEAYATYRYAPHNTLSLEMQDYVRNRVDAANRQRFENCKAQNPSLSDDEIYLLLSSCDLRSRLARKKNAINKLNRVYSDNARKNKSLME